MSKPADWKHNWTWSDSSVPGVVLVFFSSVTVFLFCYFGAGLDEIHAGMYGFVTGFIVGFLYNIFASIYKKKGIHILDIILFDFWW
jgi:cbb3-type cytochrome oxidase subunit 1